MKDKILLVFFGNNIEKRESQCTWQHTLCKFETSIPLNLDVLFEWSYGGQSSPKLIKVLSLMVQKLVNFLTILLASSTPSAFCPYQSPYAFPSNPQSFSVHHNFSPQNVTGDNHYHNQLYYAPIYFKSIFYQQVLISTKARPKNCCIAMTKANLCSSTIEE